MQRKNIIYNKIIVGIVLALVILFSIRVETELDITLNNYYHVTKTDVRNVQIPISFDFTPHVPIEIVSDDNFTDYGFPGSGNTTHPYIIENYIITTTDYAGIYISGTTKYFLIRNCYVDAEYNSIYIENVADGTTSIINNICNNNSIGIYLRYSSGCTLTNNTCNKSFDGIYLYSSSDSTITENTCNNNYEYGIYLSSSSGSTLTDNTCTFNNGHGISLEDSSGSTLTDNTCTNNAWSGIILEGSSGSTLTDNTCINNNNDGITLISSDSCLITYNLLQENEEYGIYLGSGSSSNIIHHNTFIDNNISGASQATDEGENNKWYDSETKEGNWWSDLEAYCTYNIDGTTNSKDKYPLNRAQNCLNPAVISTISIVIPVLVSLAVLALVIPKYGVPYTKKTVIPYLRKRKAEAERQLLKASLITCPNCGNNIELSSQFCEKCGTTSPEIRTRLIVRHKKLKNLELDELESRRASLNRIQIFAVILFVVAILGGVPSGILLGFALGWGGDVGLGIFLVILCLVFIISIPLIIIFVIKPNKKALKIEMIKRIQ